jgi:hypothetical protein
MDFVHDQLVTGRKVLTIVDTFLRFFPAWEARFSFRRRCGGGVPRDLDLRACQRGVTRPRSTSAEALLQLDEIRGRSQHKHFRALRDVVKPA